MHNYKSDISQLEDRYMVVINENEKRNHNWMTLTPIWDKFANMKSWVSFFLNNKK